MLKLNLLQPLKNLSGEVLKDSENKEVLLGKVMANAIISVTSTTDPTKNYLLATKIYQAKEIDLTAEDLEYLKKQVMAAGQPSGAGGGNMYIFPILYKGQILDILDKVDKAGQ